jgi:hypothetical protein
MGLTARQIQNRWDKNVKAVQDAKQAAADARQVYADACDAAAAVYQRSGFKRRQILGHLTSDETNDLILVEEARIEAQVAIKEADEAVKEAQTTFKAGVE